MLPDPPFAAIVDAVGDIVYVGPSLWDAARAYVRGTAHGIGATALEAITMARGAAKRIAYLQKVYGGNNGNGTPEAGRDRRGSAMAGA